MDSHLVEYLRSAAGLLSVAALIGCLGCATEAEVKVDGPSKDQVRADMTAGQGKGDAVDALCNRYNQPIGCDLCQVFGWYGDGRCDAWLVSEGACKHTDPDCPGADASAPRMDAGPYVRDSQPYYPDSQPYYPDAEPYYPDAQPYYPDAQPYYPDAQPYYPDA